MPLASVRRTGNLSGFAHSRAGKFACPPEPSLFTGQGADERRFDLVRLWSIPVRSADRQPDGPRRTDDVANKLLERAHVGVAPGVDFGAAGEGKLRFCYAVSESRLREALSRMEKEFA